MTVRKTESRLPDGFAASALGQAKVSPTNANVALVAYLTTPVALRRTLRFVVFVWDAALAPRVDSYTWTFTNGAAPTSFDTDIGIAAFSPQNIGNLAIRVQLKDAASTVLETVTLDQQVIALNSELELLIDEPLRNAPLAAHPDTARELINDLRAYVDALLPAEQNAYVRMLCSTAFIRCQETEEFRRHVFAEDHAAVLNKGKHLDFLSVTKDGFGICKLRPQLLAMVLKRQTGGDYLALTELPAAVPKRAKVVKAIKKEFDSLSENDKIDLFNLLRFPKSHFEVTKRVCDKLQTTYLDAETFSATLGNTQKAHKLLTELDMGPVAVGKKFKPSGPAKAIRALMGNPLWKIKPAAGVAAPPPGGGPAALAPGPVGVPEPVPTVTFVGTGGDPGFLANARAYHTTSGIVLQTATSFESMVHELASSNAPIPRLRIVSHFAYNLKRDRGQVKIPFFENQKDFDGTVLNFTNSWYLDYGVSDDAGLLAFFVNEVFPDLKPGESAATFPQLKNNTATKRTALHTVLLGVLRVRAPTLVARFGLQNHEADNVVLILLKWCADLFAIDNSDRAVSGRYPTVAAQPLPPAVVLAHKAHINAQIDALMKKTGLMVEPNVSAFRTAVTGLTLNHLPVPVGSLGVDVVGIGGVFVEKHPALRAALAAVRNRLDNAFVDFRGCRISHDEDFMKGLRSFFGNPGREPTVSGPDWIQSFTVPAFRPLANESAIDNAENNADVRRAYADWAGMIGLNAHLSFWTTTLGGDAFSFLTLAWVHNVPPLGMFAIQLAGLSVLTYPAVLEQLKAIFFVPAAIGPTPAEMSAFSTTYLPQVLGLKQAMDQVDPLSAASTQNELQAALQFIQAVAAATAQTLPAAPAPLTLAYLQSSIATLKQFLVTTSKIAPLLAALKAKSTAPNFGIRTMLGVGLPLLVQSSALQTIYAVLCLGSLQEHALKSLLSIHWEQPLPPHVVAAIAGLTINGGPTADSDFTPTNDTARALQLIVLNSLSTKDFDNPKIRSSPNPENEYRSHIKTEP